MLLTLKAKHFKRTEFYDVRNCAICKAAQEQLKIDSEDTREYGNRLMIKDVKYKHEIYVPFRFENDSMQAEKAGFDETVIRTIELSEE